MIDLTPQERCERVRMALAEMGYSRDDLEWLVDIGPDGPAFARGFIKPGDVWRALHLAKDNDCCWPCFRECNGAAPVAEIDCPHDPLSSPWPGVVR